MFAFLFQAGKFFRALSNGVFVDQAGIQTLKQKLQTKKDRVVLLPQFKSFADIFVLLFALASNEIEIPFSVGSREDMSSMPFLAQLLNGLGYIALNRSRD